jgi:SET domain-containing protein 6
LLAYHTPGSKLTLPQLELLEENDILDDGYVIPRPTSNASLQDILPAELVVLLTTLSLTPEEFEQRRSKNKPPKPSMESNQASFLYKLLQSKQAQYGSSLNDDIQLLTNLLPPNAPASLDGSARRQKMAMQVRIGEKEVLQGVLAMLEPLISGGSLKRSANGDAGTRHSKSARV